LGGSDVIGPGGKVVRSAAPGAPGAPGVPMPSDGSTVVVGSGSGSVNFGEEAPGSENEAVVRSAPPRSGPGAPPAPARAGAPGDGDIMVEEGFGSGSGDIEVGEDSGVGGILEEVKYSPEELALSQPQKASPLETL